jgi:hypothetical protein
MSTPKKEEAPSSGKKDRDGKHRSSRHRDRDGKHRDRDGKDRKGRHRHDDKERRSRSSSTTSASSQSKSEKPAHIRSYEAGPRLIDISPSSPKTPSSPALSATAPASPGRSFLDHAPSPASIYEQIGSPSLGTSAAPMMSSSYSSLPELASSPLVSGSVGRDKSRSSRDSKSGGRRSKKDKDDRKRKDDPKSSSRHGDKKSSKKEKDIFADYKKDKKDKKEKYATCLHTYMFTLGILTDQAGTGRRGGIGPRAMIRIVSRPSRPVCCRSPARRRASTRGALVTTTGVTRAIGMSIVTFHKP